MNHRIIQAARLLLGKRDKYSSGKTRGKDFLSSVGIASA